MSRLIFAPAAQADIDSIYDYTAERWGPDQAERYVMQIRDLCLELALEGAMPMLLGLATSNTSVGRMSCSTSALSRHG